MLGKTWSAVIAATHLLAVWCKTKAYVGIDLGTTFSCVSIYCPEKKSYDYLTYDDPKRKTIPSTIYFNGEFDGETPIYKVGYLANALNEADPDPKRYIYGFKRIVGIDKIESKSRLSGFEKEVNYPIRRKVEGGKGYFTVPIEINGKEVAEFTPTELSAMVLKEIRNRLEEMDLEIISTCITTPVYFTPVQDGEVRTAGEMAGFPGPILITKEPVAACVSYVDEHVFTFDVEEKVMVFDFGGGTLDISVLEVIREKVDGSATETESSIVANNFVGDNFLGGENVNTYICQEFTKTIESQGYKLSNMDNLRLRLFVEELKIDLCNKQKASSTEVTVTKDFWVTATNSIELSLSHSKFNELLAPIYKRIDELMFDSVEGLFKGEGAKELRSQIKKVVLVGGSTRIPEIRNILKKVCPQATIYDGVDADKAVGMGACKSCVNADPNSGISSIMVLGAVPLPIGIRLSDGTFEQLIQQNVPIPTDSSKTFTTVYDNQTSILIDIAMGVRPMFEDNEKIGKIMLQLKNQKPRGVPQISVKIEYFADYSFKVTAEGPDALESKSVEFKSDLGKPSKSKIDQILETAKKFKAQDEEISKVVEVLRLIEAALNQFEAQFTQVKNDTSISLSDLDKSYFETILEGNLKWLNENRGSKTLSVAVVQAKLEDIQNVAKELVDKVQSARKEAKPEGKPEEEKVNGRDVL